MYHRGVLLVCVFSVIISSIRGDCDDDDVNERTFRNTYDYIVVGVGMAGSVVAARLAEAGYKVLGVEAGGPTQRSLGGTDFVAADYSVDQNGDVQLNYPPYTRFDVPAFYPTLYQNPTAYPSWRYYRNGVLGDSVVGKHLGGSGAHNGMLWLRWSKAKINSWNVDGWSYDDFLPYYMKSENVTGSTASDSAYHGFSGPVHITDTPTSSPYYASVDIYLDTCKATGQPFNPDFNGESRYGCGTNRWNIDRGVRSSTAHAYLPNALKSGKLTLSLFSEVTKILLTRPTPSQNWTAYGVQYVKDNVTLRAYANKEVIITASAIFTPKLLMLSGIGNSTHLAQFNITTKVDNPNVGKNLGSNHGGNVEWQYPNPPLPSGLKVSSIATEYAMTGTGPWSWAGGFAFSYGCINETAPCPEPDYYSGYYTGGFLSTSGPKTITGTVGTHNPKTRGTITLTSADPFAPPNLAVNNYDYDADVLSVVAGIKRHRQIFTSPPANTIFGSENIPGPTVVTDAQLQTWVRTFTGFGGHWVGSAKFGNIGDPTAVLDPKLKVLGVDRLRVGDCSAFPSGNAHSQASAAAIGERVAAFVIADA